MMSYILTKSIFIEDKERISKNLKKQSDKYKYRFRLFDDDGEMYYEGLSIKKHSFEPLDDEKYRSGCTEIHYLENGRFVNL